MLESTITRKGQVTIPKAIRDRLGVKEGEKVLFVMRGEEVVLKVAAVSAPRRFRENSSVCETGCCQEGGRAWLVSSWTPMYFFVF